MSEDFVSPTVAQAPTKGIALDPLKTGVLPEAPKSFWKLLGPSFIMVGLGLGTGELILWPYLVTNWGMGIIWGALLGITMQFFLNMEIERYALANGESIFVGFARIFKKIPYWFVASTIVAWSWPGFSRASAELLIPFGVTNPNLVAIIMLLIAGAIITLGPILYKTLETFHKTLVIVGIPLILFITIMVASLTDVFAMFEGLIGIGDGYRFFPHSKEGADGMKILFPMMSFLAALAYSGAGGNLLLAQSFYVKEKGYGMGIYAKKLTSVITGSKSEASVEGTTFIPTEEEVKKFNQWWKVANQEHAFVFWGLGLFTMLLLAVLGYATVYGNPAAVEGISFLFLQAGVVGEMVTPLFGAALLLISSLMLFSTQLSVLSAAGRIISENVAILGKNRFKNANNPLVFYGSVWMLIIFGIIVLLVGIDQPQTLIILGAVLNAICMVVFAGLLNKVNKSLLPKQIWPSMWRQVMVWVIFVILFIFSSLVIADKFFKINISGWFS